MSDSKKRKKSYYANSSKKKKINDLDVGMKGFLLTCNNKEKGTVREAYNLFNEYADAIYGPQEQNQKDKDERASDGDDSSEEDISAALQKEVAELKSTKPDKWRFKSVASGANNCVFVSTILDDPNKIIESIFTEALATGVSKTRYILRMLPILGTCRADEENIEKLAKEILPPFFEKNVGVSHRIEIKVRNNKIGRHLVIPVIGRVVSDLNIGNHVNLRNPDYVINVDIIRTICCLGVLPNFDLFKKYNIQEVYKATSDSHKNRTLLPDLSKDEPPTVTETLKVSDGSCDPTEDNTSPTHKN